MARLRERLSGGVISRPTRTALLETICWDTALRRRRFGSPTLLSTMFLSTMLRSRFALSLLRWALRGRFVGSGVELVWPAGPAYSADRCLALLKSGETTIAAAVPVVSAPFIGIGCSRIGNQKQGCHRPDSYWQPICVRVYEPLQDCDWLKQRSTH